VLPDGGAPLAPGDGHASRRDVEGAPGGVLKVGPVAGVRHVRLACQPDVDLAAAEPLLKVGHVEADRGVVVRGFLSEIDALPNRVARNASTRATSTITVSTPRK
jgi:hypothetical protein